MTKTSPNKPKISPKGNNIIRISCIEDVYNTAINDNSEFKILLNEHIRIYPELFPESIAGGYTLQGKTRHSKKLDNLQFQKIKISSTGVIFSIYPSFVMPNLIAYTKDVEHALLLRKHDVPYSTLVYIYGKNEMYWYRAEQAFSKCSIVGTTIKKKSYCQQI
jgi:hypothetical protein